MTKKTSDNRQVSNHESDTADARDDKFVAGNDTETVQSAPDASTKVDGQVSDHAQQTDAPVNAGPDTVETVAGTSEVNDASQARDEAGATPPPADPPARESTVSSVPASGSGSGKAVLVGAGVVVVALAIALWFQHKTYNENAAALQAQVSQVSQQAAQALEQSRQVQSTGGQQADALARLQAELEQSRSQIDALTQTLQTLTDTGSDLVLLNDVDHLVTIAQQQLQLGGNVANAIVALETAQAQLARANRPAMASLLQTLNGDLERLRAVSTVDVAMLVNRLETLSALVSQAPLMVPDNAAPEPIARAPEFDGFTVPSVSTPETPDTMPWWEKGWVTASDWASTAWNSVSQDLERFIVVRRVDDATAMLLSPDQAARFRENLRLRILTAQLALMMRQPTVWQTETAALVKAVESRFDERSPDAREALRIARQMQDTNIDTQLPTVTNSLKAIEALRDEQARQAGARDTASEAAGNAGAAPTDEAGDSSTAREDTPAADASSPASDVPANAAVQG